MSAYVAIFPPGIMLPGLLCRRPSGMLPVPEGVAGASAVGSGVILPLATCKDSLPTNSGPTTFSLRLAILADVPFLSISKSTSHIPLSTLKVINMPSAVPLTRPIFLSSLSNHPTAAATDGIISVRSRKSFGFMSRSLFIDAVTFWKAGSRSTVMASERTSTRSHTPLMLFMYSRDAAAAVSALTPAALSSSLRFSKAARHSGSCSFRLAYVCLSMLNSIWA